MSWENTTYPTRLYSVFEVFYYRIFHCTTNIYSGSTEAVELYNRSRPGTPVESANRMPPAARRPVPRSLDDSRKCPSRRVFVFVHHAAEQPSLNQFHNPPQRGTGGTGHRLASGLMVQQSAKIICDLIILHTHNPCLPCPVFSAGSPSRAMLLSVNGRHILRVSTHWPRTG